MRKPIYVYSGPTDMMDDFPYYYITDKLMDFPSPLHIFKTVPQAEGYVLLNQSLIMLDKELVSQSVVRLDTNEIMLFDFEEHFGKYSRSK